MVPNVKKPEKQKQKQPNTSFWVVVCLVLWKILTSGSHTSARFCSIKGALCRSGTWEMSDVPGGKRTNLLREPSGLLSWLKQKRTVEERQS